MACGCARSGGTMDDASINYLMEMIPQTLSTDDGNIALLNTDDPFVSALVDIILEKAQYLNEAGTEYLIMKLRQRYVERVPDKGLSTNDFTNDLKKKLDDLPDNSTLQNILNNINSAEWEVVNSLPTTGKEGTIYLVRLANPDSADNQYAEYIWVNGKWELLGIFGISGNGLVSSITFNNQTKTPDASGKLALGLLCVQIKFGGSTYSPNNSGVIDIGSVDLSGYMPISGGTFTGNVRFQTNNANYGSVINMGDGDYVHFKEDTDDHLEIYASKGINLKTGNGNTIQINGVDLATYISNNTPDGNIGTVTAVKINSSTKNPNTAGLVDLGSVCIKVKLNDTEYSPNNSGVIDLGTVEAGNDISGAVQKITINGSTKSPNTSGTVALGGVCTKITLNGSTYNVSTTGTIALGTIESGGGGGNAIHTGTTVPSSSLGDDGDFYYKTK